MKTSLPTATGRLRKLVPKIIGADIELGNFLTGPDVPPGTGPLAARLLLREVAGLPQLNTWDYLLPGAAQWDISAGRFGTGIAVQNYGASSSYDHHDWGRKYLKENGGCIYVDANHLEACLPEIRDPFDHVACWRATLDRLQVIQAKANARLDSGRRIQVLVNNSDGQSNSYGSHLDFLMNRDAWSNILERRAHYLGFLASFYASSILLTGQGKVGSENGRSSVAYQISQRADFFEMLLGHQTTHNRPMCNSRDEAHCGGFRDGRLDHEFARLHDIFHDSTLCPGSTLLKVGPQAIILAMIEAEWINPTLILEEPVSAAIAWSHDPSLRARVRTMRDERLTLLEMQFRFCENARVFVDEGWCDGIVPQAERIMTYWEDTLARFERKDFSALARRLDWVLKKSLLELALKERPDLTWESPALKHLDLLYGSLDAEDGLFLAYERAGLIEPLVSSADVDRLRDAPRDTRAWTRSRLLRLAQPEQVENVNWDSITFRLRHNAYSLASYRTVALNNPLEHTRVQTEPLFNPARSLSEVLDALGAYESDALGNRRLYTSSAAASRHTAAYS